MPATTFEFATFESSSLQSPSEKDLIFSTFLGDDSDEHGRAITIDSSGSIYIAGYTDSADFLDAPGSTSIGKLGMKDIFIAKFSNYGTTLEYLSIIGGSLDDTPYDLAVDGTGAAYLTGTTSSSDFPTTPGSFADEYLGGASDIFLIKLHPSGTSLEFGTFFGSATNMLATEIGFSIAVDASGASYIGGRATTPVFGPLISGYDTSYNGGWDGFIAKFNPAGTSLIYGTYIGGNQDDQIFDIVLDASGSVSVVGTTASALIPDTTGSFQPVFGGGEQDALIAKLAPDGNSLDFISYLGGSGDDYAVGIACDHVDALYITGRTNSDPFPFTNGSAQPSFGGEQDAFVAKIASAGDEVTYATYLGGSSYDIGHALAVQDDGSVLIAGNSASEPFITTPDSYQPTYGGGNDAFAASLNPRGDSFTYFTYLGGSLSEEAYGVVLDHDGFAYLTGRTGSSNFPWTEGVFDTSHNGMQDAFVLMIGTPNEPLPIDTGFLNLPIEYSNFADAANGKRREDSDPSRVNSWFDHTYPTYSGSPNWDNENLTRWDEQFFDFTSQIHKLGLSYYDGHNGIDFSTSNHSFDPNDKIFAAAAGTVMNDINKDCINNQDCDRLLGNFVWIDHGNCYSTRYGHMREVFVDPGEVIDNPTSQPLGIMGNTGNSRGKHLHFDVLYDIGCDGDWSYGSRVSVDPYGWIGVGADPWGTAPNRYLWDHPLGNRMLIPVTGVSFRSPSGFLQAIFPKDTFSEPQWVELWDLPSLAIPWPLRSSGRGAWLRGTDGSDLGTFGQPVTLNINFDPAELSSYQPDLSVIKSWDEATQSWTLHSTTVDPVEKYASTQLNSGGKFELLVPVLVPEDEAEPDNNYDTASILPADQTSLLRFFGLDTDEDWFAFSTMRGLTYEIQISNIAPGVLPVLELFDRDGTTLLQSISQSPDIASEGFMDVLSDPILSWVAPTSGTYFLRVTPEPTSLTGAGATYEIFYSLEAILFLPLITR